MKEPSFETGHRRLHVDEGYDSRLRKLDVAEDSIGARYDYRSSRGSVAPYLASLSASTLPKTPL